MNNANDVISANFPGYDSLSLMNRMNQIVARRLQPCSELDVQHRFCDHLERFPERFEKDLSRNMFVSNSNDGLALRAGHISKLQTITKQTGIPWIRVQKIYGPIFCKFPLSPNGRASLISSAQ
ncbi:MAG TPA: hypothetical protein VKR28_03945 [Candidatus Binatus sp.]|nr:hypothetical protein [Candidatus Binatus sp.]